MMRRRPSLSQWNIVIVAALLVISDQWHMENSVVAWTTFSILCRTTRFHQLDPLHGRREPRRLHPHHSTIQLHSKKNNDPDPTSNESVSPILEQVGIVAQPIVGISLISVATTGGGLPAGPLGLVGAVEGLSYLVVVFLAFQAIFTPSNERSTSQQVSLFTIALGFAVLLLVLTTQGCIPNAKPILDYSAYVRVCDPN